MTVLQMLPNNGVDETRTRDLLRDSSYRGLAHASPR
jgi:hypothetical protein